MGHEEFGDGGTKAPHRNIVNLFIYLAGGIIESDIWVHVMRIFL